MQALTTAALHEINWTTLVGTVCNVQDGDFTSHDANQRVLIPALPTAGGASVSEVPGFANDSISIRTVTVAVGRVQRLSCGIFAKYAGDSQPARLHLLSNNVGFSVHVILPFSP
jgi:hypothetical protein